MKKLKKSNQHYINKQYLLNFCQGDRICLRDTEKQEYRCERVANVATKSHYYSKSKDGEYDYTIEEGLGDVESNALPVLRDLSQSKQISLVSKFRFALFAAYQLVRVPKYQRHVERMATQAMQTKALEPIDGEIKAYIEDLIKQHGPLDLHPDDWRKTLTLQSIELRFEREFSLREMIKHGLPLAKFLYGLNWVVLHAMGTSRFVTSDNPFVLLRPPNHPNGVGFDVMTAGCGKFLALTPQCALLIGSRSGHLLQHLGISDPVLDDFNRIIATQHFRYMFAQSTEQLEKVKEIADKSNESKDVTYNRYDVSQFNR